ILMLDPRAVEELAERGQVYERLECFKAALDDFQSFLSLAPEHPAADVARAAVLRLGRPGSPVYRRAAAASPSIAPPPTTPPTPPACLRRGKRAPPIASSSANWRTPAAGTWTISLKSRPSIPTMKKSDCSRAESKSMPSHISMN